MTQRRGTDAQGLKSTAIGEELGACMCGEKKRRIGKRTGLLALGTGRKNSLESGPEADKQVPEER